MTKKGRTTARRCALAAIALAVLVLLLVFRSSPAPAQYVSTGELGRLCTSEKNEQMSACINYVAGVIDYHQLMMSFGTAPTIDFCLPENVSKERAAALVLDYLRTEPQHDAFTAASTIPLALNKVYPCQPVKKARAKKRRRS